MKRLLNTTLLLLSMLSNTTIFAQSITPNVPHGTPIWADENDVHVACVIMGEARGEGDIGQSLVADVIYTRMISRKLTAYEVVTQPHQFSGYYDRTPPTYHIWKLVLKLKHGVDILPTIQYEYFRSTKVLLPDYATEGLLYRGHIFFNE